MKMGNITLNKEMPGGQLRPEENGFVLRTGPGEMEVWEGGVDDTAGAQAWAVECLARRGITLREWTQDAAGRDADWPHWTAEITIPVGVEDLIRLWHCDDWGDAAVLYLDVEAQPVPRLDLWTEALVSSHLIVARRRELADVLGDLEMGDALGTDLVEFLTDEVLPGVAQRLERAECASAQ